MKKMSRARQVVLAGALASAVTVGVVGTGVASASTASASPTITSTSSTEFTKEVFRQKIGPWKGVTVPPASCGDGAFLVKDHLAPGRIVPNGVEVIEPGGIGIGVNFTAQSRVWSEGLSIMTGYHGIGASSTATNWNPLYEQELVVNLHCTTDRNKADVWGTLG